VPNWVQVWSDEFNGSSLGSDWYIDDFCPRPELVAVSAGVLSLTADAGCGVDVRSFAGFEPDLAVEYRARGVTPEGYGNWGIAHLELSAGNGGVDIFIHNDQFRTYRVEWIDGVTYSSTDGMFFGSASTVPFAAASGSLRLYVARIDGGATRMEVDYIRIYRPA
jgi:hypothetical protein